MQAIACFRTTARSPLSSPSLTMRMIKRSFASRTLGVEPILCTPEHQILVWTTRDVKTLIDGDGADPFNGFVWLAAKDIHPADFIVTAAPLEGRERRVHDLMDYVGSGEYEEVDGLILKVNTDLKHRNKQRHRIKFVSVNRYVEESYDLGLILGWYVAEGHISKRSGPDGAMTPNGIHFTIGTHELEYQQELAAAFKRVFAADLSVHQSVSDQSVRMVCNSKVVASLILSMVGTGYHLKRLSHEVLTADEEFQRGLLAGLFRGDGCSTTGGMVLDLVNPELIDQVQLLLRRVGIMSRVRQYTNRAGNMTGQVFVPGLPGANEEFIFDVGKNLHNYVGQKGTSRKTYQVVNGRHVYGIRELERTEDVPAKVYNLHVEGTHTYTIRGTVVHNCFLLRIEDNMESIARSINSALQLSKRGGGVALLLSNIREHGAPIKNIENQSSGVIPVMKLLEDRFCYANQLGARQGAGAVYLHAHHPDIYRFLDTKRENADEKIRIKTLSLGVVIPDITFELAKKDEDMYLFSPYDVERVYGVPFGDISVTEKYREMVDDARIRKTKIKAREFFQTLAEIQFESGYPYIMYEDTVNRANPIEGRISMSNLCSRDPAGDHTDGVQRRPLLAKVGKDISCNLGSMNIAQTMDSPDFAQSIEVAIRGLTAVSDQTHISSVPSIEQGNNDSHAIGLGQMNLHGYLAREHVFYGSEEGIDFTNIYFYTVLFHAMRASNRIAIERGDVLQGLRGLEVRVGRVLRQVHRAGVGAEDRQGAASCSPTPTSTSRRRRTGPSSRSRWAARHLQPEPAGGAADRVDLLHQPLDVVDPPDRVEGRDPQGRQDRAGVLPGALHDEREPRVLRGRLRNRLREGHRHLRCGHAARGSGAVADAVLQGHRHHARRQQGADLRVAQGNQDLVLHPAASDGARGHRARGLRLLHAVGVSRLCGFKCDSPLRRTRAHTRVDAGDLLVGVLRTLGLLVEGLQHPVAEEAVVDELESGAGDRRITGQPVEVPAAAVLLAPRLLHPQGVVGEVVRPAIGQRRDRTLTGGQPGPAKPWRCLCPMRAGRRQARRRQKARRTPRRPSGEAHRQPPRLQRL